MAGFTVKADRAAPRDQEQRAPALGTDQTVQDLALATACFDFFHANTPPNPPPRASSPGARPTSPISPENARPEEPERLGMLRDPFNLEPVVTGVPAMGSVGMTGPGLILRISAGPPGGPVVEDRAGGAALRERPAEALRRDGAHRLLSDRG